ncbi:MAG: HAMP domain-containing sensor histidine kinase [Gammaproteobacteria bacterium]
MFKTLYGKLALVLCVLFCLIGGIVFVSALKSAHMYQQEVEQRLNRDLAMYIVNEHVLIQNEQVNTEELEHLFHTLMIVNPSLELYLLGPTGNVLSYSGPPGLLKRDQVAMAPIQGMLGGKTKLPVLGDDPRSAARQKAFSVAPIKADDKLQGYIYAILGGEQVDHLAELLQSSYILRWSTGAVGAAMLFAFIAGLMIFFLLTRRLRKLSQAMESFKQQGFKQFVPFPVPNKPPTDEIGNIGITFNEMAKTIGSQMERLRETDALRRELVANVSHDLRTPLASLKGYIETLLLMDQNLSETDRRHYLETAGRNADRLSKLVEELFELAKLDAKDLKPHPESFSVAELVHDVMQKFKLRAEQQGVRIEVDVDPATPFAEADIGMIERVLDNLIENALQHTPKGGSIHLSSEAHGQHVEVKVADSGHGIPENELPHIFERFYRKSSANAGSREGAGLGLAIAQRIVELHGGKISVQSTINHGSVFGFNLPFPVIRQH